MLLKKQSIYVEEYNIDNQNLLLDLLSTHLYFQDLNDFSFKMFPTATIFLLRGSTWFHKNLIIGFCMIIDCKNLTVDEKYFYAKLCQIDYEKISSFYGIILQELGIMPSLRHKGLGCKLFNHIKLKFSGCQMVLRAMDSAVGFWEKMNFIPLLNTQNTMILNEN